MLRRMLLTGLVSGLVAGLAVTALQQVRVVPLILEAETYERAAGGAAGQEEQTGRGEAPAHGHAEEAPAGWARTLRTGAANVAIGAGFALLLAGAYGLWGRPLSPWRGLLWGLGGFAAFSVAPALGLPPELPGAAAVDVAARQWWWLATVAATAAGLALALLQARLLLKALGGMLLVLPHLVGAPALESGPASSVPAGLAQEFIVASLLTSAAFWLVLGLVSGWLFRRLE